jgi:hypothetical protein
MKKGMGQTGLSLSVSGRFGWFGSKSGSNKSRRWRPLTRPPLLPFAPPVDTWTFPIADLTIWTRRAVPLVSLENRQKSLEYALWLRHQSQPAVEIVRQRVDWLQLLRHGEFAAIGIA